MAEQLFTSEEVAFVVRAMVNTFAGSFVVGFDTYENGFSVWQEWYSTVAGVNSWATPGDQLTPDEIRDSEDVWVER